MNDCGVGWMVSMLQSWQVVGNLNILAAGFDVNEGTWPRISKWGPCPMRRTSASPLHLLFDIMAHVALHIRVLSRPENMK